MRGGRLLRTCQVRAVRSAAALLLLSGVASTGLLALSTPAHAIAPAPTITSPAATSASTDASPVVTFTGGGLQYECAVTSAGQPTPSWSACSSPWSVPTLSGDATYTLAVREQTATDDGDEATVAYTLDTVADLTVTPPTSPGNDPRPTWQVSVEPGGSATCSLDGAPATSCAGGFTPGTDLAEGDHSLDVTATDALGNTSAPDTSSYTLDTTAPGGPAVSGSSGTSNDTTPSWTWSNPEDATALCTLDTPAGSGSEVACTSKTSFTAAVSAEGDYVLSVVLRDAAGNRSAVGVGPTYTLDTTPSAPAVFTAQPVGPSTQPDVSWSFTTPGATTTCALVGTSHGTVDSGPCSSPASYTLPGDDSWKLVVTEDDGHGNTVSTSSSAYLLDTTGPDAPVLSAPSGLSNDPTPHVTWTGEMPTTAECRWQRTTGGTTTNGPWTDCSAAFFDPTLPGDGSYAFQARLTDPLGNLGAVGTSGATYQYDGTAPLPPALTTPSTPGNDTTPTVSFSPELPGGTAACTFYSGTVAPASPTWTGCTSGSYTPSLTADGTWTLAVRLSDAAGNTSAPSTFTYVLDTAGPTPVVITAPKSPDHNTQPVWKLKGDGASTLSCVVYAGTPSTGTVISGPSACPTSYTVNLSTTPDGAFTLEVTATDTAGNTAVSTSVYVLDTAPPPTPKVNGPAPNPGNTANPTWTFAMPPSTTADCRLVQGISMSAWSDCSSGTYAPGTLPDGTYTVDVVLSDLAGNLGSIGSSPAYTSDRTAPDAPTVSGPTGPGNDTTPTWTWTGEAGVTATCRLDRAGVIGSAVACNSGTFAPKLTGDTSYVVVVQLKDAVGNVGAATTTQPYLLDTVAPATPVVSGPTGTSNVATVAWSWTAESGSTSRCVLVRNGVPGSSGSCTSGSSWTLPSDGTYALQVTVVDAAGNPSVTVQTPTYTLDRVAPPAPSVTTPASPSNSFTPAFTFSAEAGSTTQCRLMRGTILVRDWTSCTNPPGIDLTGLSDATYALEVRATDVAGNTGPVGSSLGYQLDTTAPAAPTVTVPSSPSTTTNPTVTWVGEAGTTASCRLVLNGTQQSPINCTSPWTPSLSPDGSWVVRVRLTDAAGNQSLAGVSSPYVLDTTAPTTPVVTPPAPLGRSTAPSWSASYETGATAECKLTSGATVVTNWAGCTLPYVTDLSALPDATYTLSVRVTDEVGLVSPVGSASYQLDTTAPAAPVFTSAPASPGRSRSLSFSFTTEAGTTTFCKLTSGATTVSPETTCSSPLPVSLAGLADGAYTLSARSVDAAGNAGPTQTATYVLDTTAPAAPVLVSGPAATAPDKTPTWTFTAEAGATVTCRVTGTGGFSTSGTCTSPYSVSLPGDDTYTFTATATDAAGNTSAALTRSYVLDATAPTTADIVGPKSPGKVTSPSWQVSSSEGTIQCLLVKGASVVRDWATCGPTFSVALPGDGTYTLSARVVDTAGNLSPVTTSTYVLDTSAPAPATIVTPSSPSTDRAPSFVISSSEPSVTAQCQVTGPAGVVAAFAACPISTAGTSYNLNLGTAADGSYTLSVRLTDAAGNTGATASATYVLDTTAPNPVLVTAPATPSADDTPTWALTGDSDATLECRLSGPGFTAPTFSACPTGAVPGSGSYTSDLTAKADGTYTLTVRSRDAAGNLGPESSSSYALDRTPPVTPAPPSVPVSPSNVSTVDWAFTVEPGATALCTLSSASAVVSPEAPCTSPLTTVLPADGTYTLTLRARDAAGNLSGTSTAEYVYDSSPPAAPSIDTELASPNPDTTPTWQLTASEAGDRLMCKLVGLPTADFTTCTSPVSYDLSSWTSGVYHLEVVEYDAAGNASAVATGKTYVLDTTAPAAALVYPPSPAIGNSTSPVFDIQRDPADTDTVRISCVVTRLGVADGTVADPCAYGAVNRIDLSDLPANTEGKIGLGVYDYDSAGNTQSEPATAYYSFDNKPPTPPLIRPLKDAEGLSPKVSWSFGRGDAENVAFVCAVAKRGVAVTPAEATDCTGTKDVSLSTYGEWVLTVWAEDAAGNFSTPATSSYLYLPPVPVVTSIKAPTTGTDSTPTWTFTVPRGGYTATCLVSDSHGTTIASGDCNNGRMTADLGTLPGGVYTLSVQLTDSHGNRGAYSAPSAYRYAPRTSNDGHLGQPGPATPPGHTGGGTTPGTSTPPPGVTEPQPAAGGASTPQLPGGPATTPGVRNDSPVGAGTTAHGRTGTGSGSTSSTASPPSPGGFITKEATKAIGKTLAQVAQKPTIPLLLLAVVVGFLLLQNRIDRRDPKLASAPVGAEPELDFGPVQQLGRLGLHPGPSHQGRTGGAPA